MNKKPLARQIGATMMNKNPLEFMLTPESVQGAGAEYRTCFAEKDVVSELSSDFTLPDYYPEIRKLLRIETNVSPSGRYIGSGSVEFSGKVDYEMIYVTADGGLASAPLGCDYAFEVPISRPENATEPFAPEMMADSTPENVIGRVLSPRKVGIKCRLRSRVRGYCAAEYAPCVENDAKCEKLTDEILCADGRRYMSEELTLSVQIPCETELLTPVYGHCDTYVKDISDAGGLVTLSGEARLKVLCVENGQPTEICENMPFNCEVETDVHGDGASQDLWTAFPYVTDTDVTVEDGRISAKITLLCCVDLHRNSPLTVIKDIYSTEGTENIKTDVIGYNTVLAAGTENVKFSQTIRPGTLQLTDKSRAFDVGGTAELEGCTYENGKISLSGRCRVTAVILTGGEYSVMEEGIPFSLSVPCANRPEGEMEVVGRASLNGVECKIENGSASVSGNVYLSYSVLDGRSITAVKSVEIEGESATETGITVCYPAQGQTMWNVAKKYRVPLSRLASANDLPMSALSGPLPESVKFVMICK